MRVVKGVEKEGRKGGDDDLGKGSVNLSLERKRFPVVMLAEGSMVGRGAESTMIPSGSVATPVLVEDSMIAISELGVFSKRVEDLIIVLPRS